MFSFCFFESLSAQLLGFTIWITEVILRGFVGLWLVVNEVLLIPKMESAATAFYLSPGNDHLPLQSQPNPVKPRLLVSRVRREM